MLSGPGGCCGRHSIRHALVTLCIGPEYEAMGRLTHPYMKLYAARHGLDFVVLTEKPKHGLAAHFAKFQLRELLCEYERIIYADTDILIHPRAQNPVTLVSSKAVGAYLASRHCSWHTPAIQEIQDELGPIPGWTTEYFQFRRPCSGARPGRHV